ncbi:MAG: TlyA family RNA methyltransferase [Erysipelotrichaceae bacterium]
MKLRLDKYLSEHQLCRTRSLGQDAIDDGRVYVNDVVIKKNSYLVSEEDQVKVLEASLGFASRAGHKLEGALESFQIKLEGRVIADIGASTGGFSDACLKRKAKLVYAIDVGHDQLLKELIEDPRIINMEGINARYLTCDMFSILPDFACIDVSFISLTQILNAVQSILVGTKEMVVLIKPQFEAGKSEIGKNGIVKSKKTHINVLTKIDDFVHSIGLYVQHVEASSLAGRDGNLEYVMHISNVANQQVYNYRELVMRIK